MNKILNSRFFSVFLLFLIFWLGNGLVKLNDRKIIVEQEIKTNENKVAEAQQNTDEIAEFITNFENPAFLEREARMKLNYKSVDEEVAFIYRDTEKKASSQSFEDILKSMPNWKKWQLYLFGFELRD